MHQGSERYTKWSTPITQPKTKETPTSQDTSKREGETARQQQRSAVKVDEIVVSLSLRDLVYQELHEEMGHLGGERLYQLAKERFYWPGMEKDIKDFIRNKCICLTQKKPHMLPQAPFRSVKLSGPMDIVGIDS